MITDNGLVEEHPHPSSYIGGVQRMYRWGNWGLSVVNGAMLHSYPFAWEAAVVKYTDDGWSLNYTTPLTSDVEVFSSDEECNQFIDQAAAYFTQLQSEKEINSGITR